MDNWFDKAARRSAVTHDFGVQTVTRRAVVLAGMLSAIGIFPKRSNAAVPACPGPRPLPKNPSALDFCVLTAGLKAGDICRSREALCHLEYRNDLRGCDSQLKLCRTYGTCPDGYSKKTVSRYLPRCKANAAKYRDSCIKAAILAASVPRKVFVDACGSPPTTTPKTDPVARSRFCTEAKAVKLAILTDPDSGGVTVSGWVDFVLQQFKRLPPFAPDANSRRITTEIVAKYEIAAREISSLESTKDPQGFPIDTSEAMAPVWGPVGELEEYVVAACGFSMLDGKTELPSPPT